ncbi:MAG: ABC transporter permease [Lachnospiraceae bacterium]|nr:ABC transporter permease [Ruminococcus sp.]MCM1275689.1 ABC transporter permease [Lachnospiraceae bacterium]
MKLFKRYSVVSVMILLCFFSAFSALCSGLLAVSEANENARIQKEYAYSSETAVYIRSPKSLSFDDLSRLVSSVKSGNIYLDDMMIWFNEIDGAFIPNLLLKQNEPLSLPPAVRGKTEINFIPENGIICSTKIGDFDTLSVLGKTFSIAEKIDAEKYPFVNTFTLNAKDYFAAFPDALGDGKSIALTVNSNKIDTSEIYSEIKNNAAKILPNAEIYGTKRESKDTVLQSSESVTNVIAAGLFLFALINTVTISYYWVNVRRREIAIRKAFGASDFRVMGKMTAELLTLIGTAAVPALITQFAIRGNSGKINFSDLAILAAGMLIGITLATVISMIVPMRVILGIKPSEGVRS